MLGRLRRHNLWSLFRLDKSKVFDLERLISVSYDSFEGKLSFVAGEVERKFGAV